MVASFSVSHFQLADLGHVVAVFGDVALVLGQLSRIGLLQSAARSAIFGSRFQPRPSADGNGRGRSLPHIEGRVVVPSSL